MTSREAASVTLLALFALWALTVPGVRGSVWSILKGLMSSLGAILALYLLWLGAVVGVAWRLGYWSPTLLGGTTLWMFLVGLSWFFNSNDASRDDDFFKKRLLHALSVGALVEFFVNIEPMPYPVELLVQVILTFLTLMTLDAIYTDETRPVQRAFEWLVGLVGFGLFAYVTYGIVQHWRTYDPVSLRNELLLPVWLTIGVIPFLYGLAYWMVIQSVANRMTVFADGRTPWRSILGVALLYKGRLVELNAFNGLPQRRAAEANKLASGWSEATIARAERRAEIADAAAARQRLVDLAGVTGVDEHGRLLDRREFAATKRSLRWIATCHSGQYRKKDRYRRDLMTMFSDFEREGIPGEHGIQMKVRQDCQAWYAYRQTPCGHYFGIGNVGTPNGEWYYDGPTAPRGYPSKKTGWTNCLEPDRLEWRGEAVTEVR